MATTGQRLAAVQLAGHHQIDRVFQPLSAAVRDVILRYATPDAAGVLRLSLPARFSIRRDLDRLLMNAEPALLSAIVTAAREAERAAYEPGDETRVDEAALAFVAVQALGSLRRNRPSVVAQADRLVVRGIAAQTAPREVGHRIGDYFSPFFSPRRAVTGGLRRADRVGSVTSWPGRSGMASAHVRGTMLFETTAAHGRASTRIARRDGRLLRYRVSHQHLEIDECCRQGTMIATDRGSVAIENVQIGDRVLTHKGRFCPVTRLYRTANYQGSLLRLQFQEGSGHTRTVVLTPNHPVLTDRGWIAANDMRMGSIGYFPREVRALLPGLSFDGGLCRASRGFGESVPLLGNETGGAEQCGASPLAPIRTASKTRQGCDEPIFPRVVASDRGRSLDYLRSSSDCVPVIDSLPASFVVQLSSCDHGAHGCQSSDLPPLVWGCIGANNIADGVQRRTLSRTTGTSVLLARSNIRPSRALRHERSDSKPWSSNDAIVARLGQQIGCRMSRKSFPCDVRDTANDSHRSDCRIDGSGISKETYQKDSEESSSRTIRKDSQETCSPYVYFTMILANIEEVGGRDCTVYNLGVADDQSYVADGLVVHNCSVLERRDVGFGIGLYPPDEFPTVPRHFRCRCWAEPAERMPFRARAEVA